jgi:hypothetical protein
MHNSYSHLIPDILNENYDIIGNYSYIPSFFNEFANDKNVYIISADWSCTQTVYNVGTKLLSEKIKKIVTDDLKLSFDNLQEGNLLPLLSVVYKLIDTGIISPEQIYCFTSALNTSELHNYFCELHNYSKKNINIYAATTWERHLQKNILSDNDLRTRKYEVKVKQKKYICWNRVLRWHRYLIVGLLSKYNLLDEGYVSFFPNGSHHPTLLNSHIDDSFLHGCKLALNNAKLFEIIEKEMNTLSHKLPLKVNIEMINNKNFIDHNDVEYFENSYYSLVTETFYFPKKQWQTMDESGIFFTEKIFKPIAFKHPFILASRPHSLKWLKHIGYKTFHPFINESYDNIESDSERLLAIIHEVKRLNRQSNSEWIEWQQNVKSILDYNIEILLNKKFFEMRVTGSLNV